jgi:MFS family permease
VVSGPGGALAFDAVTFAASILLLLRLKVAAADPVPPPGEQPAERFWESLRNGWAEVRSRSWVLGFLGAMSSYHLVVLPSIFVLGPVLMDREYAGARSWALITTCFGVGSLVGDVLFLRWRPRHAMRVAALALLLSSCQAAVIGSGLPVWAMGILIGLCGVGVAGAFTLWSTSLAEHIPHTALSRVSSYDYLVTAGAIPLGNIVAGIVGGAVGLRPTLLAMTAIGAAVCLAVAFLRSVRHLPRGAET